MARMLKFMKPHSRVTSPDRLQQWNDIFDFNHCAFHGFPAKPSALAWDPKLNLVAVATKSGHIRIYGNEGVEFYGYQEESDATITKLCFLPGKGSIVSLDDDNTLCLWRVEKEENSNRAHLVKRKTAKLDGKVKEISSVAEDIDCKVMFVGTEGGNIHILDLEKFSMTSDIIYQDVVMQNVPEDYKVNPGPVECIAPHPEDSDKILIGYQRGLIVHWDKSKLTALQTFVTSQQLEYLCWNETATEFVSSHNDGSFVVWSLNSPDSPKEGPTNVYGPYPCKPINKIAWKKSSESRMTIFSGGMQRANFGDRFTVTVMEDDKHATFNLTSRVVDFVVTSNEDSGAASVLVILAEEEIVFVDLASEGWPSFQSPYLSSLHASAVTCAVYVSSVDAEVVRKIRDAGVKQMSGMSCRGWPITGGVVQKSPSADTDLLLTGHEDGTVRIWDASNECLVMRYKLSTANIFVSDGLGDPPEDEEDDWPPFRKVGVFDPYSDDPRLAIKKLEMCPLTGLLVVGGTAGQIIVYEINPEESESVVPCVEVNVVAENDKFEWKSHSKLDRRDEAIKHGPGMQPLAVVQFYPPASFTAVNLHSEWGLVAAGTAHGFALFDYVVKKNLLAKSTLSPLDYANTADDGPMSRRKSLKKSLRESFRRLRRGRSQKKNIPNRKAPAGVRASPQPKSAPNEDEVIKPVERAIEARTQAADYIGSMVRCLHITKCYIASSQLMSATLWAGTNSGAIYIFTIAVPPSEKRMEVPLTVQLGKEIHLKHGAPVIQITILDGAHKPIPGPMAVKRGASPSPDNSGPHRVLITSEEQFKVFTLPQLKPFCKLKLTAHEGARIRKIGPAVFRSKKDPKRHEFCLMVVTNAGDVSVHSLPDIRRKIAHNLLKKEDIAGINSVLFTKNGEILYMTSPSEMGRASLSAHTITRHASTLHSLKEKSPAKKSATPKPAASPVKSALERTPDKPKPSAVSAAAEATAPTAKKAAVAGDEPKENGDTSVLSGDITIDSIRDHLDDIKISECSSVTTTSTTNSNSHQNGSSSGAAGKTTTVSTITEESTKTTGSVTVVKKSNVTIMSSQETTSVQVIETSPSDESRPVNGTE